MRLSTAQNWLVAGCVAALAVVLGGLAVAAPPPPEAPKVSTFAPAEDLANQMTEYIESLEKAVATEQEYKDAEGKISKESNALILIALALGLHDSDNPHKSAAAALVKAAQDVAAAKDFAATKKAVEQLKVAAQSKAGGELKWEKKANLDELMKQVPMINTKMKRYLKGSRFKSNAKDTAGYSAVLAVIAQGSMADTSETKNDEQVKQWYDFCAQMREAASGLNKAIHAGDESAADAAMKKLTQSCDDCHAVFHKEEAK